MNLKHLVGSSLAKEYSAFVAVVEQGSITAAAKSILSTPPSVSKWVTSLESRLGVKLLERSTHAVSITDVGQAFYLKAREVLEKIQQAELMLNEEQTVMGGKLNISLPTVLLKTGFLALIKDFKASYPNVLINLHTSDQFVDLVQDKVDFAIRMGGLEDHNCMT